tara:strand:- start:10575 stop:11804 length:1230 start_codon:yes stop_codon:yes gene_type:complete
MHILFLTDNFPPEGNAPASRTFEHAREWYKKGHKITVITSAPNFPEGKVFDGYKNKFLSIEEIEGINVWRVKTYIASNKGFYKRILDFISFMISSFLFGIFVKKPDVVIGTSPQFFTVISAWAIAKFKRKPFIFELRDIWPASITAVGAMQDSFIIKLLEKAELFLYEQADLIISVTKSFKLELEKRGVLPTKIMYVPNGVDLEKIKPLPKDESLSNKYNLDNKFVAAYIGTHGLAHSLEHIVEAAEILKDHKDLKIVFAGGGAVKENIKSLVNQKCLKNVVMIPAQPKDQMRKLWSLCDVSLVTLKDKELFKTVIPSKIFESMAMQKPVIISIPNGESTKIVESNNCGVVIPPENEVALSEAILTLKKNKALLGELGNNSLKASQEYNRKVLACKMLSYIEQMVTKRK